MSTSALEIPVVHLNGSGKTHLLEGLQTQLDAVRLAHQAMLEHGPNARDYYPNGPAAFTRARFEHECRLNALVRIRTELENILEHVVKS